MYSPLLGTQRCGILYSSDGRLLEDLQLTAAPTLRDRSDEDEARSGAMSETELRAELDRVGVSYRKAGAADYVEIDDYGDGTVALVAPPRPPHTTTRGGDLPLRLSHWPQRTDP